MARVVSAYGAAKTRHEVTVRATAERQAQFQPVRVNIEDVDECQEAFEEAEGLELTEEVAPGKAYYERNC